MPPALGLDFWDHVDVGTADECWPWTGRRKPQGYGMARFGAPGNRQTTHAHRLAYELTYGPVRDKAIEIDHLCRNPPCCNPAHLEAVTPQENKRRRRGYGTGRVEARGPGTWRVWVEGQRDPLTGKRRRITKTVHGTEKNANEALARLLISVRDGNHRDAAITFGELIDRWLQHAEPNLAPYTARGYRSKIETHIRPALGHVKLEKLTTAKLDAFYRELLARGRRTVVVRDDGTPETKEAALSAQSVRHVHAIIRRACAQGRRWGWLDRNPAELAEPPTVDPRSDDLPPVAEIARVLEKLTPDQRQLVWVAIITGARRGEICGLRWSDVDFDTGKVTIARSVSDTADELTIKGTKTGKTRSLDVDTFTLAMLTARHTAQAEKALECGVPLEAAGYVFSDIPGGRTPLRPQLVSKRWANAAGAAKVKCRFHDLRHTNVTELLEAGFEVGAVSGRVGHASKVMTLDRYQHSRRSNDAAASEYLVKLFGLAGE